jgi:uncharacterized OB-fold protein
VLILERVVGCKKCVGTAGHVHTYPPLCCKACGDDEEKIKFRKSGNVGI